MKSNMSKNKARAEIEKEKKEVEKMVKFKKLEI